MDIFALGVVGVEVLFRIRGDSTEAVHQLQSGELGDTDVHGSAPGSGAAGLGGDVALLDLFRLMLLRGPSRRITVQTALQNAAFGARRPASQTPRRTRRSHTDEESKTSPDATDVRG